jgi:hypothetical protein
MRRICYLDLDWSVVYLLRMTNVLEIIPESLQAEVGAALDWFNTHENASYDVTGIVDPPVTSGSSQDLRLVLCGEGVCRQETFKVVGSADVPEVEWLGLDHAQDSVGVAELDPPPGARKAWLADVAGRNSFAVLLFYRGFW